MCNLPISLHVWFPADLLISPQKQINYAVWLFLWPWICSVCCNHNPVLSSFIYYHRFCNKSKTIDATSVVVTSGAHELSSVCYLLVLVVFVFLMLSNYMSSRFLFCGVISAAIYTLNDFRFVCSSICFDVPSWLWSYGSWIIIQIVWSWRPLYYWMYLYMWHGIVRIELTENIIMNINNYLNSALKSEFKCEWFRGMQLFTIDY